MAIRNSLAIVIVGSLLALPDTSSHLPASRHPPLGRATPSAISAPTKTAVQQHYYQAAPKSYRKEAGEIVACRLIVWKLLCRVRYIQKAATPSPTTTEAAEPRTTTSSPFIKKGQWPVSTVSHFRGHLWLESAKSAGAAARSATACLSALIVLPLSLSCHCP